MNVTRSRTESEFSRDRYSNRNRETNERVFEDRHRHNSEDRQYTREQSPNAYISERERDRMARDDRRSSYSRNDVPHYLRDTRHSLDYSYHMDLQENFRNGDRYSRTKSRIEDSTRNDSRYRHMTEAENSLQYRHMTKAEKSLRNRYITKAEKSLRHRHMTEAEKSLRNHSRFKDNEGQYHELTDAEKSIRNLELSQDIHARDYFNDPQYLELTEPDSERHLEFPQDVPSYDPSDDQRNHQITEAEKSIRQEISQSNISVDKSDWDAEAKERRQRFYKEKKRNGRRQILSRAGARKLTRLVREGMPRKLALDVVLKRREDLMERRKQRRLMMPANSGDMEVTSLNPFSSATVSSKNIGPASRNRDLEIGISDTNYPDMLLDESHLELLRQAVIKAVEELPENGPEVRFRRCTIHPGMLLIDCADEKSRLWCMQNVVYLQPWEGAQLRVFTGPLLIKQYMYSVVIPDDDKGKVPQEVVLTRLKKMNHELNMDKWTILDCREDKKGQLYIISVDAQSNKVLAKSGFRPYYGFGQLRFARHWVD